MDLQNAYDVIVVGDGPAGLMAALVCARARLAVALIKLARESDGAESCVAGAPGSLLKRLLPDGGPWGGEDIASIRLVSPSGYHVTLRYPDGISLVDRSVFQKDLHTRFAAADGEIYSGRQICRLDGGDDRFSVIELVGDAGERDTLSAKVFIADAHAFDAVALAIGSPVLYRENGRLFHVQCHLPAVSVTPGIAELHVGSSNAPGTYIWLASAGKNALSGWGVPVPEPAVDSVRDHLARFLSRWGPAGSVLNILACEDMEAGRLQPYVDRNLLCAHTRSELSEFLPGTDIADSLVIGNWAAESAIAFVTGIAKDTVSLRQHYVGKLAARPHIPLDGFERIRRAFSDLSDSELDEAIAGLGDVADGADVTKLAPLPTLWQVIKKKPRLWKLARHLA